MCTHAHKHIMHTHTHMHLQTLNFRVVLWWGRGVAERALRLAVGLTAGAVWDMEAGFCIPLTVIFSGGLLKPPVCCPCRPVCGVAGIPSSQSGAQHHMQHSANTAALPHCSHTGGGGSALAYRTQMDSSPSILMPSNLQTPQTQEQNGILDWLRKLRLHKYYPVFKQLTMEKVCWLLSVEFACFPR